MIDAEKSYLKLVKKFKWTYIKCTKPGKYTSKSDIKSPETIGDEIYKIVEKELKKQSDNKKRMTRFL